MAPPDTAESALRRRWLFARDGLSIAIVTCTCTDAGWAAPELSGRAASAGLAAVMLLAAVAVTGVAMRESGGEVGKAA